MMPYELRLAAVKAFNGRIDNALRSAAAHEKLGDLDAAERNHMRQSVYRLAVVIVSTRSSNVDFDRAWDRTHTRPSDLKRAFRETLTELLQPTSATIAGPMGNTPLSPQRRTVLLEVIEACIDSATQMFMEVVASTKPAETP